MPLFYVSFVRQEHTNPFCTNSKLDDEMEKMICGVVATFPIKYAGSRNVGKLRVVDFEAEHDIAFLQFKKHWGDSGLAGELAVSPHLEESK